jgi:WD40 repeat protein
MRSVHETKELYRHVRPIRSISLSTTGSTLAVAPDAADTVIIDLTTKTPAVKQLNNSNANAIAFNRDGSRLILGRDGFRDDERFQLIDVSTGHDLTEKPKNTVFGMGWLASGAVQSILLRPGHEQFVWISYDQTTMGDAGLRDASTGSLVHLLESGENFTALAISNDGVYVAAATSHGDINLFDCSDTNHIGLDSMLPLRGHADKVRGLAFSPNGKRLA